MRVMHVCKFPFCLNFSLHSTSRSRFGGSQEASNSPRYWLLRIVLLGSACHKWQTFFLSANFCTISCQAAYRIPRKYLIHRLQLFVACTGDMAHSGAVYACKWVEAWSWYSFIVQCRQDISQLCLRRSWIFYHRSVSPQAPDQWLSSDLYFTTSARRFGLHFQQDCQEAKYSNNVVVLRLCMIYSHLQQQGSERSRQSLKAVAAVTPFSCKSSLQLGQS